MASSLSLLLAAGAAAAAAAAGGGVVVGGGGAAAATPIRCDEAHRTPRCDHTLRRTVTPIENGVCSFPGNMSAHSPGDCGGDGDSCSPGMRVCAKEHVSLPYYTDCQETSCGPKLPLNCSAVPRWARGAAGGNSSECTLKGLCWDNVDNKCYTLQYPYYCGDEGGYGNCPFGHHGKYCSTQLRCVIPVLNAPGSISGCAGDGYCDTPSNCACNNPVPCRSSADCTPDLGPDLECDPVTKTCVVVGEPCDQEKEKHADGFEMCKNGQVCSSTSESPMAHWWCYEPTGALTSQTCVVDADCGAAGFCYEAELGCKWCAELGPPCGPGVPPARAPPPPAA